MNFISRRNCLKAIGLSIIPMASGNEFDISDVLPRGVASGVPSQNEVTIWVGLPPIYRFQRTLLKWEVSTDQLFSKVLMSGHVWADSQNGGTAQVRVSGLQENMYYYYRFYQISLHDNRSENEGFVSEIGRTKTLPSDPEKIRFCFVSCFDYCNGYFNSLEVLEKVQPDFVISLGDNIYETGSAFFQKNQIRKDSIGGGEAKTLEDYRNKYRLYLTDPSLRRARAQFPWFTMWDDHEVFNNFPGKDLPTSVSRKKLGRRAFFEFNPTEPSRKQRPYFDVNLGSLADFFFTDQRSFRSAAPCRDTIATRCKAMDAQERTLLGKNQLNWLKNKVKNSQAKHKIIAQQTMISPLLLLADRRDFNWRGPLKNFRPTARHRNGIYANLDSWDGFPEERRNFLSYLVRNEISDVTFITGDIHTGIVSGVHENPEDPSTPLAAYELVTPSIASATFAELSFPPLTPLLNQLLLSQNPWQNWVDTKEHGLVMVDLNQDSLKFSYLSPASVRQPITTHSKTASGQIFHSLLKLDYEK